MLAQRNFPWERPPVLNGRTPPHPPTIGHQVRRSSTTSKVTSTPTHHVFSARFDILVHGEQVVRIVLALHLGETIVVRAVGGAHAIVSAATPVVELMPTGVARPWTWVAASRSASVAPPSMVTRRAPASTGAPRLSFVVPPCRTWSAR